MPKANADRHRPNSPRKARERRERRPPTSPKTNTRTGGETRRRTAGTRPRTSRQGGAVSGRRCSAAPMAGCSRDPSNGNEQEEQVPHTTRRCIARARLCTRTATTRGTNTPRVSSRETSTQHLRYMDGVTGQATARQTNEARVRSNTQGDTPALLSHNHVQTSSRFRIHRPPNTLHHELQEAPILSIFHPRRRVTSEHNAQSHRMTLRETHGTRRRKSTLIAMCEARMRTLEHRSGMSGADGTQKTMNSCQPHYGNRHHWRTQPRLPSPRMASQSSTETTRNLRCAGWQSIGCGRFGVTRQTWTSSCKYTTTASWKTTF